jgi:hypothetical protein
LSESDRRGLLRSLTDVDPAKPVGQHPRRQAVTIGFNKVTVSTVSFGDNTNFTVSIQRNRRQRRVGQSSATSGQDRALMLNLPVRRQVRPYWQNAAELLLIATSNKGAIELAHAHSRRALMIEGLL